MQTHIRTITADDCLALRHRVLWPQCPVAYARLAGDEVAQHFGLYLDTRLVSCLSVFTLNVGECQIRKFATDTEYQHQGHGSKLMTYVLAQLENQGIHHILLNARLTATPFYARFDFRAIGAVYYKQDIPYVVMEHHAGQALPPTTYQS